MFKKNKIMALFLASATACSALAGCAPSSNNTSGSEASKTAATTEKVKLTYANWNATEKFNQKLVEEFNQQHDNIEVVLSDNVDYTKYDESLTTLASAGNLPDIFALSTITQPLANQWLADMTQYAEADSEWNTIFPALRESVRFNSKVMAIPSAMHFYGLLVNDDAFEKVNAAEMPYNPTVEEFEKALKGVTKPENGVVGLKLGDDLINVFPAATNSSLGYFTFDDEKYTLDGPDFANGVKKARELREKGYTWQGLSETQLKKFQATEDWQAWEKGEVAVCADGTWGFGGMGDTVNFNLSYKGMLNGRTVLVPDFLGVSSKCEHPAEAMEFIKFMGYGKDGFETKLKVAEELNTAYFGMPMTSDESIQQKVLAYLEVDGLKEAFDGIDGAMVEPTKIIPGYQKSRWTAETGTKIGDVDNATIGDILTKSVQGEINYADYAAQVNELANQQYQDAKKALQ